MTNQKVTCVSVTLGYKVTTNTLVVEHPGRPRDFESMWYALFKSRWNKPALRQLATTKLKLLYYTSNAK